LLVWSVVISAHGGFLEGAIHEFDHAAFRVMTVKTARQDEINVLDEARFSP
jgi:hypothetical protein